MISSLRGMNDILSDDYERFTYFISTATKIAQRYGFHFIQTPLLEETALFKRSVGESSDIVGKEMYQFIDKARTMSAFAQRELQVLFVLLYKKNLTVQAEFTAFSITVQCLDMRDRKKVV